MNKEEFVIKFYSCDSVEQFLKDVYHNLNCLQQENKQLKTNWNKLKEYLNYKSERAVGEDEYVYDEIYNEMQEMEKNYGNVGNNT